MANIAFTTYFVDGEKEQLNDFYSRLRSGLLQQAVGTTSLSLRYVMELTNIEPGETDERSAFIFVEGSRGKFVNFQTETPYTRDLAFEEEFNKAYPKLKLYFEEDATECGAFRCNDEDEKYFKGCKYYLSDIDNGSEYFDTAEELIEHFKKTYNVNEVEDVTDVRHYINHLNEVDGCEIVLYTKQFV